MLQEENLPPRFVPLLDREYFLAKEIVDIAFKIHRTLGPGLMESIYEKCFAYELNIRNIPFERQQWIAINYENFVADKAFKIDLWIDEMIIIELKAQELSHIVWQAQLLSYLKLTGVRLGYIINFHVPLMKDGIKRMIL